MSERSIQVQYFNWIRQIEKYDERYKTIHAVPNSTGSSRRALVMVQEGLRKGVWDVRCDFREGFYAEFKSEKGRLSSAQKEFRESTEKYSGCKWYVWRNFHHAVEDTIRFIEQQGEKK